MTNFTIKVFRFFQKHHVSFYLLIIISFAFFAFFCSKLTFEEDVSKLLPSTDNTKAEGLAFSELKVKDKIIVQFLAREGQTANADTLLAADEMFVDLLLSFDKDGDIEDVLFKIEDDFQQNILSYLLDNVPIFLDKNIYDKIDSVIAPENICNQMAANVEKISSPEGMMYYKIMRYDPLDMRSLLLSSNNGDTKAIGGNYAMYGNYLFTPDTTTALVYVSPNFGSLNSKAGIRLVEKIEKAIRNVENAYPNVEVLFHGAPVQSVFNSRQIKKDLALTMGISLFFVCMIIMLCFRNKSTLPMLILPVVYGAFFALACMYWIQGSMSLMALGIGAVVLGVALSYCLHVLTHYKYVSDSEQVLRDQTKPVILGSLTTIGAFMGLMFTKSALLRDFGLFASLSMVGTTIACLFFLPHFFVLVQNRRSRKAFDALEKINSFPLENKRWFIIFVAIVFFVCFFVTSKRVKFDSNLRNIGYFEPKVMRSADWYESKTAHGFSTSYFAATSANLDSALIYNQKISATCDSLSKAGLINNYTKSAIFLLPKSEQEKRIEYWKKYWTPEKQTEVKNEIITAGIKNKFKPAMFEPFFEMLARDYKPSSLYDSNVIPKSIMGNMIEKSKGIYLIYTSVQLPKENIRTVDDIIAPLPGAIVADPFYYTTNMVELMHNDFNTVLGISSLFVFIVLLVSFRSIPVSLIAFLPMAISWYIVLGVMGIFGLQFNLINIVISTFIFGIGVDYSIFVMEGMLAAVRNGNGNNKMLMYHKTAIFLSAVVLIIGIASLMFAKHPAVSSIGISTLIGMISTIIITYTIEPFLFKLLMKTGYGNILKHRMKTYGKI